MEGHSACSHSRPYKNTFNSTVLIFALLEYPLYGLDSGKTYFLTPILWSCNLDRKMANFA